MRRIGQIRVRQKHFNRIGNIEANMIVNGIFTMASIARDAQSYYSRKMELIPAVSILSALAQLTRLRCYLMLTKDGDKTAGDLASALGVPANTMSSHLTILGTAGLVTSTRNGRNIIYRAEVARIAELTEFLNQLALEGGPNRHDHDARG